MRLMRCVKEWRQAIRDECLGNASDPPRNVFTWMYPAVIERNAIGTRVKLQIMSKDARRRVSRIVHDHKGNATVEWLGAPSDYERQKFEIEAAKPPTPPTRNTAGTGSLAVEKADSHDPYRRIPESERQRQSGQKTDLRKLSAWIKMMRSLEESKDRDEE
jgi:hypothetical protein